MKKLLVSITASLLIFTSPLSFADKAAEIEAEKLLGIMNMESFMEQSMNQMLELQFQQDPKMKPYKSVMIEFFKKYMSWESLKPEYVRIYVKEFTASELREMNAFYSTETGQKAIQKMPDLFAQGAKIGASRVQNNAAELRTMIKEKAEQLSN